MYDEYDSQYHEEDEHIRPSRKPRREVPPRHHTISEKSILTPPKTREVTLNTARRLYIEITLYFLTSVNLMLITNFYAWTIKYPTVDIILSVLCVMAGIFCVFFLRILPSSNE